MRPIDADKLLDKMEKRVSPTLFGLLCARIADMPTLEVVPVAREYGTDINVGSKDEYISRTEVLKLIEDIKCNQDIPKNYGTLLDIMSLIRKLPSTRMDDGWIALPKEAFDRMIARMESECEPDYEEEPSWYINMNDAARIVFEIAREYSSSEIPNKSKEE